MLYTQNLSEHVITTVDHLVTKTGGECIYDRVITYPSGEPLLLLVYTAQPCPQDKGYHVFCHIIYLVGGVPVVIATGKAAPYEGAEIHWPELYSPDVLLRLETHADKEQTGFIQCVDVRPGTAYYNILTQHFSEADLYAYSPALVGVALSAMLEQENYNKALDMLWRFSGE